MFPIKLFLGYIFIVRAIWCFNSPLEMNNDTSPYMYIVVCHWLVCWKKGMTYETGSQLQCTQSQKEESDNVSVIWL